jgi:hypothetical protein
VAHRGNRKGLDCPFCGEPESTLFVSQYPQAKAEGTSIVVILPHEFAVCAGCYFAQFVRRYSPECLNLAMTRGPEVRTQARSILRRRPLIEGWEEALALLLVSEADDFEALGGQPPPPVELEEPEAAAGTVEVSGAELG